MAGSQWGCGLIHDDETKELRIYFNPKTKLWESEKEMFNRMRRRHVRGVCVSICLIALGNLVCQIGHASRGAMVIGGLIICSAMINALIMARENLKFAGERDAQESR
jgi:hypothetical protein